MIGGAMAVGMWALVVFQCLRWQRAVSLCDSNAIHQTQEVTERSATAATPPRMTRTCIRAWCAQQSECHWHWQPATAAARSGCYSLPLHGSQVSCLHSSRQGGQESQLVHRLVLLGLIQVGGSGRSLPAGCECLQGRYRLCVCCDGVRPRSGVQNELQGGK